MVLDTAAPELGRLPEVKDNIDGLLAKKPETTQYVEQPSNTPNHFHHWTGLRPITSVAGDGRFFLPSYEMRSR